MPIKNLRWPCLNFPFSAISYFNYRTRWRKSCCRSTCEVSISLIESNNVHPLSHRPALPFTANILCSHCPRRPIKALAASNCASHYRFSQSDSRPFCFVILRSIDKVTRIISARLSQFGFWPTKYLLFFLAQLRSWVKLDEALI